MLLLFFCCYAVIVLLADGDNNSWCSLSSCEWVLDSVIPNSISYCVEGVVLVVTRDQRNIPDPLIENTGNKRCQY